MDQCLGCDAQSQNLIRGNCSRCYFDLWKLVSAKQTTWEALEAKGITVPTKTIKRSTKKLKQRLAEAGVNLVSKPSD
jgi:hypothetical protein